MTLLTTAAVVLQATLDLYNLPIGPEGMVETKEGWTMTSTGKPTTPDEVAKACDGYQYVIFGESHDDTNHKEATAALMRALHARGRDVVLGLEMFTRPNQANLNPFTMGYWDHAKFQEKANWKQEWGFDYAIYKPAFDVVKELRIPMVALNVPRDWVRQVGRGGPAALPAEAVGTVPPITTDNKNHKMVFDALMGGHPLTGAQGDNVYAAQCLWDIAMADSALKAMGRWGNNPNRVMVILAGSGHALYGTAINYHLMKQAGAKSFTVIGIGSEGPDRVRGSIGEAVFRPNP